MRIVPTNSIPKSQIYSPSQKKLVGVSFKHLRQLQDPLFGDLFCKTTSENAKDAILKAKQAKYNFGEILSNKLIYQFNQTKKDYTEFVYKLRDGIIAAGFVNYAQGQYMDKDLQIACANTYLSDNILSIISDSQVIGEDTILYATKMKRHRFEELISAVDVYRMFPQNYLKEMLVEKINPMQSEKYKDLEFKKNVVSSSMKSNFKDFFNHQEINKAKILVLESRIKTLKQEFSKEAKMEIKSLYSEITKLRRQISDAKSDEFLQKEKQLTDIKSKQNKLINDSIKDPQEKIKLFYLYKSLLKQNVMESFSINLAFNANKEESILLKEHFKQAISSFLQLDNKGLELFYDLSINESPYWAKILEANVGTAGNLKQLFSMLANSNKDVNETINALEHNQTTRKLFEEQGLDYDAWIRLDKDKDVLKFVDDKIIMQKVDMRDLKHSLFLGNQVGCCTAIGSGSKAQFAPNYVLCNFIQAIELVDDRKTVGNTMCYIAQNEMGQNVLVLDNIEVLSQYKDEERFLQLFLLYAKKLASDIGSPDMPIYLGARNKFKIADEKGVGPINLKVLGSSGNLEMYLDSLQQTMNSRKEFLSPDKSYLVHLMYKF